MTITRINGNSYYIPGPTNIGVFVFKDKYTLLIDSGETNQDARKIQEKLADSNYNIKYILNTHSHIDHCGGNIYLKENYPGSVFYASEEARLFIENPFLFPLYLYGGRPSEQLSRGFIRTRETTVDIIVDEGTEKINDEKFTIINLNGHGPGQIAIATRDRVCYLGDALFSKENIKKYSFPFLFDINEQYKTLDKIPQLDFDYFLLGHAERVYTRDELDDLVKLNRKNLDYYLDICLDLLQQPHSREELMEEIIILQDLDPDFKEYYFLFSTLGAMLSYLQQKNQIECQVENGKVYYYYHNS
jgi:glyoxylase-like metal-dependent hydrolase (beta-lactamase superfamily II)